MADGYRDVRLPNGGVDWDTARWVRWLADEQLVIPIGTTDVPVCEMCFGPVKLRDDGKPWPRCWQCNAHVVGAISALVPISYSHKDGLELLLHRFKDFKPPGQYRWIGRPLASLLTEFFENNLATFDASFGGVDLYTVVPAAPDVVRGFDHMKVLVQSVEEWDTRLPWKLDLLERLVDSPVNRAPNLQTFRLSEPKNLTGVTVALVDDTFTTGSSLVSAAYPLREAGATVVGVTLGRQLNETWLPTLEMLEEIGSDRFDITTSVLDL